MRRGPGPGVADPKISSSQKWQYELRPSSQQCGEQMFELAAECDLGESGALPKRGCDRGVQVDAKLS